MKRFLLMFALMLPFLAIAVSPVFAAPECGFHDRTFNDWGKTDPGFEATLKAGCHTVTWTSTTTDDVGSGTLTIKTVGNVDPWDAGYTLPGPQGGNYCQYRAAHEANGFATNFLGMPPGTEVTVTYKCF